MLELESLNKNIYYLQQMGIDIWQMRDIKQKIMILISNPLENKDLSKSEKALLENMLISTQIERKEFEIVFLNDSTDMDSIDLDAYKAIITMGKSSLIDDFFVKQKHKNVLPLIKVPHLSNLITTPIDKRKAFLSLCELRRKYV